MDSFFLIFGYVLIAAAVVGGGLTASGVAVPMVSSIFRQVLLGLLGLFLVTMGHDERGNFGKVEEAPKPFEAPEAPPPPTFDSQPSEKK